MGISATALHSNIDKNMMALVQLRTSDWIPTWRRSHAAWTPTHVLSHTARSKDRS
jgi:hypothetical protein